MTVNASEALVERLCAQTFFRLWSIANPMREPGKELCDLIVVCDPDVLLWSVKDISYKDTGSLVGIERWQKKAINASLNQLRGAQRHLTGLREVTSATAVAPIPLPVKPRVHKIAVALGSRREVPIYEPNAGYDHFHVLEETGLETLLTELDTITDFVDYLQKKEAYLQSTQVVQTGHEHDLLGLFLHRGRQFPSEANLLIVTDGIWDEVTSKPEWVRRKEADARSYMWDRLIDSFVLDYADRPMEDRPEWASLESVLRTMARESRFARRMLGATFDDFMSLATANRVRARHTVSPSGVAYVFLAVPRDVDRKARVAELAARCWVVRGMQPECTTVVGLATERYEGRPGFSFDAVKLEKESWNADDERQRQYLQQDLGYFKTPQFKKEHVEEFPSKGTP